MSTLMRQLEMKLGEQRKTTPYTGPDKRSKNGNRPLTFPTPYHGGKRRWADEILRAFGDEREAVYVEPFSGSAAVLLANPRPYAREILCDTNPHIVNVFRSLAWAPEVVAFWADWPTIHQDLTSRHTWLLHWAVENATEIETNPDFYDPKAAGWWLWGKSNWIGSEFGIVKGMSAAESDAEQADAAETAPPDKRPHVKGKGWSGDGVQPQRVDAGLPVASDQIPGVSSTSGQGGVNAQSSAPYEGNFSDKGLHTLTPSDKRPYVQSHGGIGIQAQRHDDTLPSDKIPSVAPGGGRGISAQGAAPPESGVKRPHAMHSGRGVSAQRADGTLPAQLPSDSRPAVTDGMRGSGVSAMRETPLPPYDGRAYTPSGKIPHIAQNHGGIGITAQREGIEQADGPPDASYGARGAIGRARQARQSHSRELELPSLPAAPIPLTGDRLKPWFLAIAQRLYRVIILNRGWQSGLTPTVLQQTRTARKPPVRVLLDPPYKGVGKLYGMSEQEANALAVASWRWAAENGSRPDWRIAYACREGDFDDAAIALGWTCSKMGIAANHRDATQEVIWFSPYCER